WLEAVLVAFYRKTKPVNNTWIIKLLGNWICREKDNSPTFKLKTKYCLRHHFYCLPILSFCSIFSVLTFLTKSAIEVAEGHLNGGVQRLSILPGPGNIWILRSGKLSPRPSPSSSSRSAPAPNPALAQSQPQPQLSPSPNPSSSSVPAQPQLSPAPTPALAQPQIQLSLSPNPSSSSASAPTPALAQPQIQLSLSPSPKPSSSSASAPTSVQAQP
ncbi:uncharacterized protein LOC144456413, partial [Phascolarctos cinereus]